MGVKRKVWDLKQVIQSLTSCVLLISTILMLAEIVFHLFIFSSLLFANVTERKFLPAFQ